ncbi:MotA/TolQ/ExbB proton channel family protein [Polaribacter sp.]|uniref:MotA/TolQ/ExbB proton channel family protein n=1 Tax=Polaribacter sp. TaxID=1920175 RepID=UPI003F6C5BBF
MITFFQENKDLLNEAVQEEKTLSIYKLIMDGGLGGQIIIALLFVLLAIALYIYFERFFAIKSASKVDKNFMNQIKDFVTNGKLESADALCKSKNTPTARLIGKGISRIGKPLDDINTAIETAGKLEVYQLEKNVSWISLFIALAPMLGFMGTVIGMIGAFNDIAVANDISPAVVAGGIKVALLTTVFGLIVAIILQIFYNYIVAKIDSIVNNMEDASISLVDLLVKYKK